MCGLLGVSIPFYSALTSCKDEEIVKNTFTGKVIIVGAGAGGIATGYLLQQLGIDFEIHEASNQFGGRMRINTDFADFPIPLGSEWLEADPSVFTDIVNDSDKDVSITTVEDDPDRKFVNYSWFQFFEDYLLPSVADKITYNSVIKSIDYSGDKVRVISASKTFTADKVVVAVPLKILQDKDLVFTPSLPTEKVEAIDNTTVWEGFKAFFEFTGKFYEDEYAYPISPSSAGEKIYYNAALGQNSSRHIVGLFAVGTPALEYQSLDDEGLKNLVLSELDTLYTNQATEKYVKHISQNWNKEPFIKGGYMTDHANWKTVRTLGESVNGKLYFAGGAYTDGEDWVSVHAAAQSGKLAVRALMK